MAGSRRPGHVEHEKKTFFSSLKNTRSGGVSQGRPKGAAPAVGAERRAFTDDAAEGTAREREKARLATTFNKQPRRKPIFPHKASAPQRRHGMRLPEPL